MSDSAPGVELDDDVALGELEPPVEPVAESGAESEADVGEPEAEPSAPDLAGALADLQAEVATMSTRVAELARLRRHDAELADRMHAEIVRLRSGEIASALGPLLSQLLRLHDRMASLAGGDDASDAALLRTQLLQVLDTAADVHVFTPEPGAAFDSRRHQGVAGVPTADRDADATVARTVRPGFLRGDGSVVRVAEVDVHRFEG